MATGIDPDWGTGGPGNIQGEEEDQQGASPSDAKEEPARTKDQAKPDPTRSPETPAAPDTPTSGTIEPTVLKFKLEGPSWAATRVLNVSADTATIGYNINEGLEANNLKIMLTNVCTYTAPNAVPNCSDGIAPARVKRQNDDETLTDSTSGQLKVEMDRLRDSDHPRFISVRWRYAPSASDGSTGADSIVGESTSALFALLSDGDTVEEALEDLQLNYGDAMYELTPLNSDGTPDGFDRIEPFLSDPVSAGDDSDETETGATVRPEQTTSQTRALLSPSATDAAENSSGGADSGGGGLSTGTIAGIGVGVGIAVLLIAGALVWLFCFRGRSRRKAKDVNGPYSAPDGQASEYMVNKETNAHVTESPHSPYSDDGSLARNLDRSHAGAAGHGHGHSHSHSHSHSLGQHQPLHQSQPYDHDAHPSSHPYSDAPPIAAPVPRSTSQQADRPGSRSGARSGTPAGNVSHLIEEGMTDADIRRLEEEERALDDAIEQAGHGSRRT